MRLYALTIFVSAFLLFQVQPMIARYVLPWYGGGPAVWTTCMLFFQVLLLVGYGYAHFIGTRFTGRAQGFIHLGLLVVALLSLPITPGLAWKPLDPANPMWRIIALLGATGGLPFLATLASSPLLQHWFSRTHAGTSPYRLFALSNAGSLIGLVTYPFVVEPLLGVDAQTILWSFGFGAYAFLCGWCAVRRIRTPAPTPAKTGAPQAPRSSAPPSRRDQALWIALAACGSIVLLATTGQDDPGCGRGAVPVGAPARALSPCRSSSVSTTSAGTTAASGCHS